MRKTSAESDRLGMALAWSAGKPGEEAARAVLRAVPELGHDGASLVASALDRLVLPLVRQGRDAKEWRAQLAEWLEGIDVPSAARPRVERWRLSDYTEAKLLYIREGRRLVRNLLAGRTFDDNGPDKPRRNQDVADIMAMCGVSRSTAHRALRRAAHDPGCMRRSVAAEVGGSHECSPDCPSPPRRFRAIELLKTSHRERMHRKAVEQALQESGRSLAAARRWRQLHPDRDPATAPRARRRRSSGVAHE